MATLKRKFGQSRTRMRQIQPKFDWMKANSFHDNEAETEGRDVMPNKMAQTKAKTPKSKKSRIVNCPKY